MASFRVRNDKWEYRITYYDPATGKRREKTKGGFRTKKDAQVAAASVENDMNGGYFERNDNITISEYLDVWFDVYKHTVKESSLVNRIASINLIKQRLGDKKLRKVTLSLYQSFLYDISKEYAKNTLIVIHQVFSMMVKHAVKDQYFKMNPIIDVKIPKVNYTDVEEEKRKYWDKRELKTFLTFVQKHGNSLDLAFFMTLAYVGLRIGEALSLQWSDIDFINSKISINKTIFTRKDSPLNYVLTTPKTKSSIRNVPFPPHLAKQLKKWKREQNEIKMKNKNLYKDNNFIFAGDYGLPISSKVMRYRLKTYAKKADVIAITPHGLRHTYTALLIEASIDIKEIQKRLGHSSITTTLDVYAHINKDKEIASINQFNHFLEEIF